MHRRAWWAGPLTLLSLLVVTAAPFIGNAPRAAAAEPLFVQQAAGRVPSGLSSSVSFPGANRAGDLIVVYVVWSNTSDVTVTDSRGNTYVPAGAPVTWNGGRNRAAVFYAPGVSAGANTVTARFGTAVNTFGIVYAHEYANLATTAPLENTISATGTGATVASGALNTSTAGDLVFAAGASSASIRLTGSYTVRSTGWDNVTADASGVAPGAQSVTGTQNGSGWVMQLVAFKPATGATPTTTTTTPTTTVPPATTSPTTTVPATTTPTTTTTTTAVLQAPLFVQQAAGRVPSGLSSSVSFPGANRAGDLIVVYVVWSNTSDVTVTDSRGNTYVPAGAPVTWNGGRNRAAVFYAPGVSAGANTVTARFGTAVNTFGIVYAHEYANLATTAPLENTISATGTGATVASGALNTSTAGDLVFAGGASSASIRLTGSYTVRSTGWDNVTADASGVAPGAQSVTGTQNGSGWVMQLVAFKPATGATPTTTTTTPTTTVPPSGGPIVAPLRQSTVNPRYFVDANGRAVLLTGSHSWNTLQDWGTGGAVTPLDFDAFVNMLVANKQNFTFLWTVELPHFCNMPTNEGASPEIDVSPMPWRRVGPGLATDGKPKFDLNQFDQSYFDRLRQRVAKLNAAGIYVGVYPFTAEWLNIFRCSNDGYPLQGANNVNGIDAGTGTAAISMSGPNAISAVQDRFVEKMIDTINDLPNVVWATSEEAPAESWWNNHQIDHIRTYETTKPFQHPVGYGAPLSGDNGLLTSNADWVAPAARVSSLVNCGTGAPRCKVVVNDSDHSYFGLWNDSPQAWRGYIWANFTHGSQVAFMDPYELYYPRGSRNDCASPQRGICAAPHPRDDNLRANLGYTRQYADRMDLLGMTPQPGISSTGNALARFAPNATEVLVYAPTSGAFTVDLSGTTATLQVEWLNPATGTRMIAVSIAGGSRSQSFAAPFSGDSVLYLSDAALGR